MSYIRVIPRDLFNEASLLKCFGRLYLCLEVLAASDVDLIYDDRPFSVEQDPSNGGICLSNVVLVVRNKQQTLYRPLNSRAGWPLYLVTDEDDEIEVFDESGQLSQAMKMFLYGVTEQDIAEANRP